MGEFKDLRKGVEINRNRDMDWVRTLDKKSSERRIGVWLQLSELPGAQGLQLTLTDEDGFSAQAQLQQPLQAASDAARADWVSQS